LKYESEIGMNFVSSENSYQRKKAIAVVLSVLGLALLSTGVFAASRITLNSGNTVNLGAGAASVSVCQTNATVNTQQTLDSTSQAFKLTTITLNLDTTQCVGKTISMAFKQNSVTQTTTWGITSGAANTTLTWGGTAGTGTTSYSALNPFDTASSDITTIAVSAQ
jgi:hypothetical protein